MVIHLTYNLNCSWYVHDQQSQSPTLETRKSGSLGLVKPYITTVLFLWKELVERWIKEEVYRFNSLDEKKQWVEAQKHV